MTFGDFISQQRKSKGLLYKDIAKALGVSIVYVCDIEKGRKNSFRKDKLDILATLLNLSDKEKNTMYDLAGKQRNTVSPDLSEYVMDRDYVRTALRTARDNKADARDWEKASEVFKSMGEHQ